MSVKGRVASRLNGSEVTCKDDAMDKTTSVDALIYLCLSSLELDRDKIRLLAIAASVELKNVAELLDAYESIGPIDD